jgi:hypothetical protein
MKSKLITILFLLISFLIPAGSVLAKKKKLKYNGNDTARLRVGPLRLVGSDTPGDEYVALSDGRFGSRYYMFVAPRPVGFGGMTGGFIIKLSDNAMSKLRSKKKGSFIIANDLYNKKPKKVPDANVLIETNYYSNKNDIIISTSQAGRERFGGGRMTFKRIVDGSSNTNPVYLVKVKGYLRNVGYSKKDSTGSKFKKFKRIPVNGSFVITLD